MKARIIVWNDNQTIDSIIEVPFLTASGKPATAFTKALLDLNYTQPMILGKGHSVQVILSNKDGIFF